MEIKKLLDESGKVKINTNAKEFLLLKKRERYSYSVNGVRVGITEKQLQGMIERMPANKVIGG